MELAASHPSISDCNDARHPPPPEYLAPGCRITVKLDATQLNVSADIIRIFTPFTMGQVLVVRLCSTIQFPSGLTLPSSSDVIFKIYDPRFFSDRLPGPKIHMKGRPWTVQGEAFAAKLRLETTFDIHEIDYSTRRDPDGYENFYFLQSELHFVTERDAYRNLSALQGDAIPNYFASASLHLPDRHIVPHVAVLEYIPESVTLKNIDTRLLDATWMRRLAKTIRQFGPLGVIHDDLNPGNILFQVQPLSQSPSRVVIIDFACAITRQEVHLSEDKWLELVKREDDIGALTLCFMKTMDLKREEVEEHTLLTG